MSWTLPMVDLNDRIWAKVDASGDCWEWIGAGAGYGHFEGRAAHRAVWEMLVGPIPEGLYLDHLCRNKSCVNPDHLEPVTPGENVRRGMGPTNSARRRRRPGRTQLPMRIPKSIHARLQKQAARRDLSVNWIVTKAISLYLDRLEESGDAEVVSG